ncbi:MAG: cysteine hydrolase [Proteobacteria bacterium]|nr:cysteine hydrolase [Pseudomonadota bacterium]MDA0981768.1 cysteine hydrolase [Pseudomonadota bacterium]
MKIDLEKEDYIRAFTVERKPDPARSALVIIDMQYATGSRQGALGRRLKAQGSAMADYRFERIERCVLPNARRLLDAWRGARRRVLFVTIGATLPDCSDAPPHMRKLFLELENYAGSREHEIIDELKPVRGEAVVNKTSNGAFATSGIDSVLRAWNCDQLYLLGVSTNMCVDTTAREAADRGYAVTLVEDACGTTQPMLHEAAMINFQRLFGRVRSTEQVLAELAGHA